MLIKLVLSVISVIFLSSIAAHACSCAYTSPCAEFSRAKAIFVGKMLSGTEKHDLRGSDGTSRIIESGSVSFSVRESFSGKLPEKIDVMIDSMKGTSCGTYGLTRGIEYLVYAYENKNDPGTLYTGVCTRTN